MEGRILWSRRTTFDRLWHIQTNSPGGCLYSLLCREIYQRVVAIQQFLHCPFSATGEVTIRNHPPCTSVGASEMTQRSQPRDSVRSRWVLSEVAQTKPCSGQQVLCFFVGGGRTTEGHGKSADPPEKAPDEPDTHGLANLAEETSIESRSFSHGLGQESWVSGTAPGPAPLPTHRRPGPFPHCFDHPLNLHGWRPTVGSHAETKRDDHGCPLESVGQWAAQRYRCHIHPTVETHPSTQAMIDFTAVGRVF